ncbi:MAG: hypothetical protein R3C16_13990 [Hyphomonadaceae bacterium]
MIAKPLLRMAASWLAIAAFAACATATPDGVSGSAPPTAEGAAAFVEQAERELAERSVPEARVAWVYKHLHQLRHQWLLQLGCGPRPRRVCAWPARPRNTPMSICPPTRAARSICCV